MSKAQKIREDLEEAFPGARFVVAVGEGDHVTVNFIGGNNHVDKYPTHAEAVEAMTKVIQQTIPGFRPLGYTDDKGNYQAVK